MEKITTIEFFEKDADYFRKLKIDSKIKKMSELMNLITIHIRESIKRGELSLEKDNVIKTNIN